MIRALRSAVLVGLKRSGIARLVTSRASSLADSLGNTVAFASCIALGGGLSWYRR